MKHLYSKTIKTAFDYLKITADDLMNIYPADTQYEMEHIKNAKVHIVDAIIELGLAISIMKNRKPRMDL